MRASAHNYKEKLTRVGAGALGSPPKITENRGMESQPQERRGRILVADDDTAVCALLRVVLTPIADVTLANDAESALAILAEQPRFDAIVSDFMLPGINGLEFVARVRGAEHGEHVPILMISGHGRSVYDSAREAGCDAFLDKPFTLEQLRATMRALLGPTLRVASPA